VFRLVTRHWSVRDLVTRLPLDRLAGWVGAHPDDARAEYVYAQAARRAESAAGVRAAREQQTEDPR
jgi:hypothetical protein